MATLPPKSTKHVDQPNMKPLPARIVASRADFTNKKDTCCFPCRESWQRIYVSMSLDPWSTGRKGDPPIADSEARLILETEVVGGS